MENLTKLISEYSPAELSIITKRRSSFDQEILATVIDLANRGYIKNIKIEDCIIGARIEAEKGDKDISSLKEYEKIVYLAFFKKGNIGTFKEFFKNFSIEKFQRSLFTYLKKEKGIYKINPYIIYIFFSFVLLIGGIIIITHSKSLNFLSIFFTSILIITFPYLLIPNRTKKGEKIYKEAINFKNIILQLKEEEINELICKDSDIFIKILPYSISFKIYKHWIEKFKNIDIKKPKWYHSVLPTNNFVKRLGKDLRALLFTIGARHSV